MSYIEAVDRRNRIFAVRYGIACVCLFAIIVGSFFWATSTPGQSYDGPATEPDDPELAVRLEQHVRTLAAEPRSLENPVSILKTTAFLAEELAGLGYIVERQNVLAPAENIIASIAGPSPDAPVLIIGAHYDTIASTPGADDNASGVAALIELARAFHQLRGKSSYEIQMVFYANEEPPYFQTSAMGSMVHAQSIEDPDRVVGMIALESMGYYRDEVGSQKYPFPLSARYPSTGNFIAFVGNISSRPFLRETIGEFRRTARIPSVGGTAPSFVQGIDWSDHSSYAQVGIPAFMVTDTAPFRNPNYHQGSDTPDTLDYQRLALVVEGLERAITTKVSN